VVDRADGARGARFRLWLPLAAGFGPGPARTSTSTVTLEGEA